MKIWNYRLNWVTITAGGLLASLVSLTGVQATELSAADSTTTTVAQNSSPTLVARAKKKPIKKKAKRKVRKKVRTTASVAPATEVTQAPAPVVPVITEPTVPPAPADPTVPVVPPTPSVPVEPPKAAEPPKEPEAPKAQAPDPFSITTKLQGEAIFGLAGTLSGDFSRNTALGSRVRLNLFTNIGEGVLTTRLQASGLGLSTQNPTDPAVVPATPEGALSFSDGTADNTIGIDLLKYEFPLTSQTQVVIIGNAGVADDFTDTINPYFDGDGTSGSISFFGGRPPIYYTVQGAGAGVRQKLGDNAELSLGFLGRTANNPAVGNGLFGGGYGAIAQLTFKTGENSKIGLTYTRSLDNEPGVPGTGSNNANLGGASNNYGLQGTFALNPQFALGGWVGYTQNQLAGADRQIWNWAVTAAAPDFGGKGNLAGILIGQEPRVASDSSGNADTRAGLHIEGFYQVKINDNFSITPGIIYLTAPDQSVNSSGATIGVIRSTFTF